METLRGGPEKGVRFSPNGRKAGYLLLTSLPIQRDLGSEQPRLMFTLLCGCSGPLPHPALCFFPFFETAIRILQCSQRRGIYKAISHASSPLILPLHAYGEVGRAGITSIS